MNTPIWPGSASFEPSTNPTPFGYYDQDYDFQTNAPKVAKFCAEHLGYPIIDVELQDINFFAAFEHAVTVYGNEVFAFKIRDNQLSLEGTDASVDASNSVVTPSMANIVRLSKQYGTEAGSGGNVTWHTGNLALKNNVQDYDLNEWAKTKGLDKQGGIEIKRVFFEAPPAITQYYDPYSGTGFGFQSLFNSFGFAAMSPATNYMMMPLSFDLQTIGAIEMNQQVRKSNYSFELINNKLRVFPIPNSDSGQIRFEYIINNERLATVESEGNDGIPNKVTSVADAPYSNPVYARINSVGREWIMRYSLALAKEILGRVRSKYSTVPIPNSEVTLDGPALISEAATEKSDLIAQLRDYLDGTSRQALLERRANESDYRNKELSMVPYTIYVA